MTRRKTLFTTGRHGDRVRVLVDAGRDRVEVHYRDLEGVSRKRIFDNTKDGKLEARAWAETYHEERRTKPEAAVVRLTLVELWQRFAASPAYAHLRPKTKIAYGYRYARWQSYLGAKARPDDTTLATVDDVIQRATKAGMALNQIRQVINVARVIYRWGQLRKFVATNELSLYRWTQPKDAPVIEPDEYTPAEFAKLIVEFDPRDGRRWRAWGCLMLAGHHGQRANALIHLKWDDILGDQIVWPAAFQKSGRELRQPLTWDAVAVLETARYWRAQSGYSGPWVFYAGGGNKSLGAVVTGNARHYRKKRATAEDTPYTYQALWLALTKAEKRAKVEHKAYRALHGLRKMSAGNVADSTNDARLGMEWIGDSDPKMMKRYLKRRDDRMTRAADASGAVSDGARKRSGRGRPRTSPDRNRSGTVPRENSASTEEPNDSVSATATGTYQATSQSQRSGLNRRPLLSGETRDDGVSQ